MMQPLTIQKFMAIIEDYPFDYVVTIDDLGTIIIRTPEGVMRGVIFMDKDKNDESHTP